MPLVNDYDFIYFAGDSFTWAIHQGDDINREVDENNRFSGLVSKYFELPEVNAGLPGCSNQYIFQKVYNDVHEFVASGKKFISVLSYTDSSRLDLYSHNFGCQTPIAEESFSFFKDYLIESYNQDYCDELSISYVLALHTLFDKFNLDYVDSWVFRTLDVPFSDGSRTLTSSLADIMKKDGRFNPNGHANILGNKRIAETYIAKIEELYGTN